MKCPVPLLLWGQNTVFEEIKMKKIFTVPALIIVCAAFAAAAPFFNPNTTKIVITATTSNIGEIVKAVGGDKVDAEAMLKPVSCPGNYDLTPAMLKRVRKSNLILSHNWEKWINKLKLEAGDMGKIYKQTATEGNWMIPYIRIRAAQEIADILAGLDSENKKYYEDNYSSYAYGVSFASEKAKKELSGAYGVKVIANDKIKDFLESYGFEVIAVYGKQEDLTVKKMAHLVNEGKKHKIKIVVDSLQAGPATGKELANSIGAKQVAVSNFVLGGSYVNTLEDNVEKLKKALE